MDAAWNQAWEQMLQMVAVYVPNLLGATAILVVGWLLAAIGAALVRGALHKTTLDNRLAGWLVGEEQARTVDVEGAVGKGVFYIIMLLVLVAFFQALGLTLVTEPLNRALVQVSEYLPRIVGAGLLLVVAWLLASGARMVLGRVLRASGLDQRLGEKAGTPPDGKAPVSQSIAETAFWLVLLLFLPIVLSALALEGILVPIQGMIGEVLAYLPNLFAAGLILLVGWLAARILRNIVTGFLAAAGADRFSESVGLARILGSIRLSTMVGQVLYVLALVPVVVGALTALKLDTISKPASDVLLEIVSVLPNIFAGIVIVLIAYVLGRLVSQLVTNLLSAAGFNVVLTRLGLGRSVPEGGRSPAEVVGFIVLIAIMLLASMEAFRILGFTVLSDLIAQFNVFAAKVLLGLGIVAVGLFFAHLIGEKIASSGTANAGILSFLTRISILVLVISMALEQMGIGSETVRLVLGIGLGAVGVALAIAFGFGARESAGKLVEEGLQSLRRKREP